jgi:hypothetical protein
MATTYWTMGDHMHMVGLVGVYNDKLCNDQYQLITTLNIWIIPRPEFKDWFLKAHHKLLIMVSKDIRQRNPIGKIHRPHKSSWSSCCTCIKQIC